MNNHSTPEQKLDFILKYLKDNDTMDNRHLIDMLAPLRIYYGRGFSEQESVRLLNKLIEDGFVEVKSKEYKITLVGHLFHGYETQQKVDNNEDIITLQKENQKDRHRRSLLLAAWFAGIVAALTFLYYVLSHFFPAGH